MAALFGQHLMWRNLWTRVQGVLVIWIDMKSQGMPALGLGCKYSVGSAAEGGSPSWWACWWPGA